MVEIGMMMIITVLETMTGNFSYNVNHFNCCSFIRRAVFNQMSFTEDGTMIETGKRGIAVSPDPIQGADPNADQSQDLGLAHDHAQRGRS